MKMTFSREQRRYPGSVCVGTSGWHYRHWKGGFYPQDLPVEDWLSFYSRHFSCVEINNTFYKFPETAVIDTWLGAVPADFVFALKASRFITHRKKLKEVAEATARFLDRAQSFEDRLGPVLFQLPPHWRMNLDRLKSFLSMLPGEFRYVMEFRDPSWHTESVYSLLRQFDVAFCQFHLAGFQAPPVITTDFVYVRLHGPAEAYSGCYSDSALRDWSERVQGWRNEGYSVFVFFDNDAAGYAVRNSEGLRDLLTAVTCGGQGK